MSRGIFRKTRYLERILRRRSLRLFPKQTADGTGVFTKDLATPTQVSTGTAGAIGVGVFTKTLATPTQSATGKAGARSYWRWRIH